MDVLADRVPTLGPKPEAAGAYRHFKLTRDADGVAWLLFDRDGSSANTLSADVIEELDKVLAALESERPAGLVIRSAKKSGFIAGADVNSKWRWPASCALRSTARVLDFRRCCWDYILASAAPRVSRI